MRYGERIDGLALGRLDEREYHYEDGAGAPVEEGERVFQGRLRAVERELRRRLAEAPPAAESVREERRPGRRHRFTDHPVLADLDRDALVEEMREDRMLRRSRSRRRPGGGETLRALLGEEDVAVMAREAAGEVARTAGRRAS